MKKKKPIRIWTNRSPNGEVKTIELYSSGYYFWEEDDGCIPICFETIKERFKEQGREFKPSSETYDYEEFAKMQIKSNGCFTVFL
jgi:hypothetical protein